MGLWSPGPNRVGVRGAVLAEAALPHRSPASAEVSQVKALPPPAPLGVNVPG